MIYRKDTVKWRLRTARKVTAIAAAAATAVLLAGCGEDGYQGVKKTPLLGFGSTAEPSGVPSGSTLVYGPGGGPSNAAAALGSIGSPAQSQAEHERVAKGDIYFKLDWARTMIESHAVPPELRKMVDQGQTAMRGMSSDSAAMSLTDALAIYDKALDLYEQQRDRSATPKNEPTAYSRGGKPGSARAGIESEETSRVATSDVAPVVPVNGEDVWSVFRSAGLKVQEAGRKLGVSRDQTAAFSTNRFETDPFEHNPFVSHSPRR